MRILSLQSSVAYGYVGNSAATFPLQRLGHEVLAVDTVNFSNHTGYGSWRGTVFTGPQVREIVRGIEEVGALGSVDLVLSGYLGSPEIAEVVTETVALVKRLNPRAQYACDPVMGNARSGCFVDPAIPPMIRDHVIALADVATPNQFELGALVGSSIGERRPDRAEILEAVEQVRSRGPRTVLVTSLDHAGLGENEIGMLVRNDHGCWEVRTPRLPTKANGSGDVTAALFAAHLTSSGDAVDALARTTSSIFGLLQQTWESRREELALVQSQDAYVEAVPRFEIIPLDPHGPTPAR